MLGAIEVLHAVKLRHALERSIETVLPAVVRALQNLSMATGLGDNGCRVMTADIVEGAQRAVGATNNDDRFSGNPRGDEVSRLPQLIRAGDELPCFAENAEPLQFGDARIDIPGRGNGRRLRQGRAVVV